jgi:hypothetical protein
VAWEEGGIIIKIPSLLIMKKIDFQSFLDLKKNPNFSPDSLRLILKKIIQYFNETIDVIDDDQRTPIMLRGVIFNLFIIENLLISLWEGIISSNELKQARDCIAHIDERIKLYYRIDIPKIPLPNTVDWISITPFGVSMDRVSISDVDMIIWSNSLNVSSPGGFMNNLFIWLDKDNKRYFYIDIKKLLLEYRALILKTQNNYK